MYSNQTDRVKGTKPKLTFTQYQISMLRERFPNLNPNPTESMEEIMYRSGIETVLRYMEERMTGGRLA